MNKLALSTSLGVDLSSKDNLLQKADVQAAKAPEAYRNFVRLYYIARVFVSVFEARQHEIPLQVWNEYRSALDHFVRHLTKSGLAPESAPTAGTDLTQLQPMCNHMQRATLDILKICCHAADEWYQEEIAKPNMEAVLALVNNGDFLKALYSLHKSASALFLGAKTTDNSLGADASSNEEVVGKYVEAAIEYEKLRGLFDSNSDNIASARNTHNDILRQGESQAKNGAFLSGIHVNLLSNAIWLGGVFVFGLFYHDIVHLIKAAYHGIKGG